MIPLQVSGGEEHVDGPPDLAADPQHAGEDARHQAAGGGETAATQAARARQVSCLRYSKILSLHVWNNQHL